MSDYYEAILQLRPARDDVVAFVHAFIGKRKNVFIAKVVHLKTGVDFYLSSQRFASSLGQQLKRRFRGGTLIETRKLFGMNRLTSRLVYRRTVLFRLSS